MVRCVGSVRLRRLVRRMTIGAVPALSEGMTISGERPGSAIYVSTHCASIARQKAA